MSALSSGLDSSSPNSLNRLREAINSTLRINGMARMKNLEGCYNALPRSKAEQNRQLHIGSLEISEVTSEKGDIDTGEYNAGSTTFFKREYAKEIMVPGKHVRYSHVNPAAKIANRLMEAHNITCDRQMLDAIYGPVIAGDSCTPFLNDQVLMIEHGGVGITVDKMTEAAVFLRNFNYDATTILGVTEEVHRQLTDIEVLTDNDFLLNGQVSAFHGGMLPNGWWQIMFKKIQDAKREDAQARKFFIEPVTRAEPYIPTGGTWDGETFIRYLPMWCKSSIDYEDMLAPEVQTFDATLQRRKPKGTIGIRYDSEFGFGKNYEMGVAIIQVLEKNRALALSYGRGLNA